MPDYIKNAPPLCGTIVIGRFNERFDYPPRDGKQGSTGYRVQVPYDNGDVVPIQIYLPRDRRIPEGPLQPNEFYAFPVSIRPSAGGKGLSYTLAAPVQRPLGE